MQKRKSNKGQNISKFGTGEFCDIRFDTIMEELQYQLLFLDSLARKEVMNVLRLELCI